jgi:hypothetical protein
VGVPWGSLSVLTLSVCLFCALPLAAHADLVFLEATMPWSRNTVMLGSVKTHVLLSLSLFVTS